MNYRAPLRDMRLVLHELSPTARRCWVARGV
jgi:hypothetical protein